jgi:TolB protein
MAKPLPHRKHLSTTLLTVFLLASVLSACASKTPSENGQTATTPPALLTTTYTLSPTETITSTPTLLPTPNTDTWEFGLVVFSMGDGLYSHLFVYDPYTMPMTRLTSGDWDDVDPAVSPDGKQVAFASNRDGEWDIYILDVSTDKTLRVTNSQAYDGAPTWSPDSQYIVYQTKNGKKVDLIIQSVTDLNSDPVQITEDAGINFDAAWSPDGRQIAFITNRNGHNELWLFDLKSADNRFTIIATSDGADYFNPSWSPDGTTLAWCKKDTQDHIETLPVNSLTSSPKQVGTGCSPVWSPDSKTILATYQQANSQYLVAYDTYNDILSLPMINLQYHVDSFAWVDAAAAKFILNYVKLQSLPTPAALFTINYSLPPSDTGRSGVVEIKNLNAPTPYLADSADESFKALRKAFGAEVGWDFLGNLDNAYLPLTATTYPGIIENWLLTGRGIEVSSGALPAGWVSVTREDFDGKTYWRLWVKCLNQEGSCGKPMLTHSWDFSTRTSGDLQAYENGGTLGGIPDGYWVDFTEFASRYGWERLPAQEDWRYYFPGTLFDQFAFRQGLTWHQAMVQLYPEEAVDLLETGK